MMNNTLFYNYLEACCTAEVTNTAQPVNPPGFLRWFDSMKEKLSYIPPFLHRAAALPAAIPNPIKPPRIFAATYDENHKNLELICDMARSNAGFCTTVTPVQSALKAKGGYHGKNYNPYHQAEKRQTRESNFLDSMTYKPWQDPGCHWAPRAP
jgi:hypothetical protein